MRTAYLYHPDFARHDSGEGHPENARRLAAIEDRLIANGLFDLLRHYEAPPATEEQLVRIHTPEYLEWLRAVAPDRGLLRLDPDTIIGPHSLDAAHTAAGRW